jgi:hypothetical protein
MSENNNTKMVVFLDYVGRTILGELLDEKTETISVRNPVILHVVPAEGGRMSIQLLPLFFREFLADKSGDVDFDYLKNNITKTSVDTLDFRLNAQYTQMFNKNNTFAAPQPEESNSPSVVKLFDE